MNGINIRVNGSYIKVFVYIYGILADLPGRALATNVKQFNGFFGCTFCYIPGNLNFKKSNK